MNREGIGRRLDWGRSEGGGRWECVGGEGGLSPYFNSSLKRVLGAKHLPYSSSPIPIHITLVLPHP